MKAPNDLSFLPDDYLENKAQRRANVICAILFLVTMVTIGLAFTTGERSLREVEQHHTAKYQEVTTAAKRIEQFKELQEKQRTMAHQAELTASLLEKVPRSLILAKITNALPTRRGAAPATPAAKPTFATKSAQGNIVGQVADAKVYDVALKIAGLAPTDVQVAELLRKLKGESMFRDVNLIISDWEKGDNKDQQYRKFQIEMTLDPNADAQDGSKNATASLGNK
jgi:Tfp pilus assembly protein PilN